MTRQITAFMNGTLPVDAVAHDIENDPDFIKATMIVKHVRAIKRMEMKLHAAIDNMNMRDDMQCVSCDWETR